MSGAGPVVPDSDLAIWARRLEELAAFTSDLPWPKAWAVLAKAETRRDPLWGRGLFWNYRLWSWVRQTIAAAWRPSTRALLP